MRTATVIRSAVLAVPLLLVALPATATDPVEPNPDTRWLAWLGCWEDADAAAQGEAGLLVCFRALPDPDGVEIRTHLDGELLAVEEVIADGRAVPVEEEGCVGTRTARWSSDGARVFIASNLRCGERVARATSGVMALAERGRELLEIHGSGAAGQTPVLGARRFVSASTRTMEEHGVEPPARDRQLAVRTARSVMAAPLDADAVVEAVEAAGSDVTRALIAELGEPFQLSADLARDLARRGVPGDVLDVMVAVSHPDRFEIEGTTWHAAEPAPVRHYDERAAAPWPTRRVVPVYASPWGFYDPFFFGTGFYGFGHPGFVGRGFFPPRVIVVQPQIRDRRARVSPASGYSSPGATDRSAVRRDGASAGARPSAGPRPSANVSPRTPRTRSTAPSATSRPSRPSTTRATPQGTRSGQSNTERRARPRGGGGGDG